MSALWAWITFAVVVGVAVVIVEGGRRLLAGRLARHWPSVGRVARRCAAPAFAFAAVVSASAAVPYPHMSDHAEGIVRHLMRIAVIGVTTWLVLRITYALTDPPLARLMRIEGERNRRARRARTQMMLLRRIAAMVVVILAVGAALFTFPAVRAVGAGVLASAGVAGLVVGIAARPTLGNLLAGLQIAFSDALRLDDVVVVQGQWGRVEELTLSYVVVRLWDDRRLILPVSYFTEQPFENWTRHSSRVVGSVELHVDWTVPIEELRTELYAMLQDNPLWDRREWVLQAVDVQPNGLVTMRALMSAADSASAWDLRCDVREHLISYIREHHPEALPRFRTDPDVPEDDPTGTGSGAGPDDGAADITATDPRARQREMRGGEVDDHVRAAAENGGGPGRTRSGAVSLRRG
ncbi:mechanosensitive ion channel family protein [Actinomadura opuntiae]|uniref:mechanosensitive ion channel family protein n=1 Tax=Actinomadura sp. OS1-43 TaxID=604315 RepID=UPI00255B3038|nr:mechanosensitive ion channel domain-containing protein [Actinomadura sp. OS1-43]MDL4820225.1 mechanosensitive ion channel [Actinomadura sp. OS1-43]